MLKRTLFGFKSAEGQSEENKQMDSDKTKSADPKLESEVAAVEGLSKAAGAGRRQATILIGLISKKLLRIPSRV
jgi:hypothetical protein